VPESLAELIHRLLAKSADARPRTADEVVKSLLAIQEQLAVDTPSATALPHNGAEEVVPFAESVDSVPLAESIESVPLAEPVDSDPPQARRSRRGVWVAAVVGAVLAAVAGVVVAIAEKDGTASRRQDSGPTAAGRDRKEGEQAGPLKVTQTVPTSVGTSPLDKLAPALIPKDERFE
jgi:hypothetical protein